MKLGHHGLRRVNLTWNELQLGTFCFNGANRIETLIGDGYQLPPTNYCSSSV